MRLGFYLEAHPMGSLYIGEIGFRGGPGESLICRDAAYVSHERGAPVDDDEYFPCAPDIAIEVLSPDTTRAKVRRKARAYLASGARLVWVIDPQRRTVTDYRPGVELQILRGEDLLSGEGALPGFALRIVVLL